MKYFHAVCTFQSFSDAAEYLHISQPSLSNAIKDLENDVLKLGDKLKPLQTSYTQTGEEKTGDDDASKKKAANTDIDEGGRPEKKEDEKAD